MIASPSNDTRGWIGSRNPNPTPFTWTRTADEILDSLTEYLTEINPTASDRQGSVKFRECALRW